MENHGFHGRNCFLATLGGSLFLIVANGTSKGIMENHGFHGRNWSEKWDNLTKL